MERFKVGNAGAFPSVLCKQNVPFYIIEGRHKPLPKHSYRISLTLRTLPASLRVLFGFFALPWFIVYYLFIICACASPVACELVQAWLRSGSVNHTSGWIEKRLISLLRRKSERRNEATSSWNRFWVLTTHNVTVDLSQKRSKHFEKRLWTVSRSSLIKTVHKSPAAIGTENRSTDLSGSSPSSSSWMLALPRSSKYLSTLI